jgi:hypothetical protein
MGVCAEITCKSMTIMHGNFVHVKKNEMFQGDEIFVVGREPCILAIF